MVVPPELTLRQQIDLRRYNESPPIQYSTLTSHAGSHWSLTYHRHALYLVFTAFVAIMTITDVARGQTRSPHRPRPNPLKLPSLSRISSTNRLKRTLSSGEPQSPGPNGGIIRRKLHRGISSIRSFFKSRIGESDSYDGEKNNTHAVLYTNQGRTAGFSSAPSLTRNPLRIQLTGADVEKVPSKLAALDQSPAEHEASGQTSPVSTKSVGLLRRKLSQRLMNTFSPSCPTVVVKPELRQRPSVQTIANDRSAVTSGTLSMSSGKRSGSATQNHSSTPPTSEGTLTGSPGSVRKQDFDLAAMNEQLLVLLDRNDAARKLSTIHEVDGKQVATIKTVEATAAAKLVTIPH